MGVNTKSFGPYWWKLLEGLASFFDDYMKINKNDLKMVCYFSEVLNLVGFILPCIYCRVSYREFINADQESTNISKMLTLEDGGKKLIYNLHNCVNDKLQSQELEKTNDVFLINEKWRQHNISYCEVKFIKIIDLLFWESLLISLGYVMCDYQIKEQHHIISFLECIGKMFSSITQLSNVYNHSLHLFIETVPRWNKLEERINAVWIFGKPIFNFFEFQVRFTLNEFQNICKAGVVIKCVKK
jgi:hypothetical protein